MTNSSPGPASVAHKKAAVSADTIRTAVIATPHAQCEDHAAGDFCDTIADTGARFLASNLGAAGWNVTYLRGDINRNQVDLNRREARDVTEFRRRLSVIYNQYVGKNLWMVDVHSYPNGIYSTAPSECVLLAPYFNGEARTASMKLRNYLSHNNISVIVYSGSRDNDITSEATEYGYTNVILLELSEILSVQRLRYIIMKIAEWIKLS